jgi:response regulator RpfG family c-di-GMP phosphodiesterase
LLTALGQPENRIAGLDAGADDYLVKPFIMEELLARLRVLQRRSPQLKPQQLTVRAFTLDDANTRLQVELLDQSVQEISLTLKEFQVLAYLMENYDRGNQIEGSTAPSADSETAEGPVDVSLQEFLSEDAAIMAGMNPFINDLT